MPSKDKQGGRYEGSTLAIRNYKRLMDQKGWSGVDVAKMLGVSSQAVSKKLKGDAFGKTVEEEARKLGIKPKEFFKEEQ